MICIEEDAGSCMDQALPYDSLPLISPCTGLDSPPSQMIRREKVSPIEITNGDFAGESTMVAAMSMKVHGGSPCAMHKGNACVDKWGRCRCKNSLIRRIGGPCSNCNLLAKALKCLNGPKEEPPIVSAMCLTLVRTACMTYVLNERVG